MAVESPGYLSWCPSLFMTWTVFTILVWTILIKLSRGKTGLNQAIFQVLSICIMIWLDTLIRFIK